MSDYPMLISNKLHSFRNFNKQRYKVLSILRESISAFYMKKETVSETGGGTCTETVSFIIGNRL